MVYATQSQRILCPELNRNVIFLMPCFKIINLKNIFPRKVKVYMFEVPVFLASLTDTLWFFVSDYDLKIKENSHSL